MIDFKDILGTTFLVLGLVFAIAEIGALVDSCFGRDAGISAVALLFVTTGLILKKTNK